MTLQIEKQKFRKTLLDRRLGISSERKMTASKDALKTLSKDLDKYNHILSFASLPEEIDLWPLNERLTKSHKLYLPRVDKEQLLIFSITDLKSQLTHQSFGILEPNLPPSEAISTATIDCILIPGLGFDPKGYRLGYGKGFYDRFLSKLENATKYGVSLKEQSLQKCPVEDHDVSVDHVYFF